MEPQYRCLACGEKFEDEHATGVDTLAPAECPNCGEEDDVVEVLASGGEIS